eukprot:5602654-Amphidinium_carterae.1
MVSFRGNGDSDALVGRESAMDRNRLSTPDLHVIDSSGVMRGTSEDDVACEDINVSSLVGGLVNEYLLEDVAHDSGDDLQGSDAFDPLDLVEQAVYTCEPESVSMPSSTDLQLITCNVNSFSANGKHVMARMSGCRSIVALEEVSLTADPQGSVDKVLASQCIKALWGAPSPLIRTSNGRLRVGKGAVPGVAFLCSEDVPLVPSVPVTERAKLLVSQGRLLLAVLRGHDHPILLVNIYAPSGEVAKEQRQQMFEDVLTELLHHDDRPVILCGDWNEEPPVVLCIRDFLSGGGGFLYCQSMLIFAPTALGKRDHGLTLFV